LSKVGLEPGTGLRSRLERIRESAVGVKASSGRVGGTVTLSTGLDPDESVLKCVSGVGGWANTETCSHNVAPVTPCLLSSWLNTVARGVSDEVCWESLSNEEWCKGVDVLLLVAVGVTLGV